MSGRRSGEFRRLACDAGGGNSNGSPVLFLRWNVCDTRFLADSAKLVARPFCRGSWPRVRQRSFSSKKNVYRPD